MNNAKTNIIHSKTINIDNKTTYTDRTVLNGITKLSVNASIKSKSMVLSGGDVYINAPLKVAGALLIHANHAYINADIQADYIAILSDEVAVSKAAISAKKIMLLNIEGSTTLTQGAKLKAPKMFATQETAPGLPSSIKVQVMDKPMMQYKELKDAIAEVQKFGPFSTADVTFGAHNYEVNFNYHNGAEDGHNPALKQMVEGIFADAGLKAPWVIPAVEAAESPEDDVVTILPIDLPTPPDIEPVVMLPIETPAVHKPVAVPNTSLMAELEPVVIADYQPPVLEAEVMPTVSSGYVEAVEAAVISSLEMPLDSVAEGALI